MDSETVRKMLKEELAPIIERLDRLNGFRNKVLGAAALLGFATPAGIAIWAIVAK